MLHRIVRITMFDSAVAAAISCAASVFMVAIWWFIPPMTDVSLPLACAPHHAMELSVNLFALLFPPIFALHLLHRALQSAIRRDTIGGNASEKSKRR